MFEWICWAVHPSTITLFVGIAASWLHTIVRKLSILKVTLTWRMKMAYLSYTTYKKSTQVTYTIIIHVTCVHIALLFNAVSMWFMFFDMAIMLRLLLDEWNNFLERINCKNESEVWENEENILQLRHWVSLRGQTLCRTGTVRIIFSFKFLCFFSFLFFS